MKYNNTIFSDSLLLLTDGSILADGLSNIPIYISKNLYTIQESYFSINIMFFDVLFKNIS